QSVWKAPGSASYKTPYLLQHVKLHHLHHQESSTTNVLLETAQEIQPATDPDDPVLHSDHRVHSHSLHNYLVWFLHLTRKNQTPERIIGCNLPSLQQIYTSGVRKRAGKNTSDPSHPGHLLFQTLPSGRRLRSIKTSTARHANSFFPRAVALLNHSGHLPLYQHWPPVRAVSELESFISVHRTLPTARYWLDGFDPSCDSEVLKNSSSTAVSDPITPAQHYS
ncbi:hypothetical protein NFI96_021697, partial [Prochilodus magdalenae]